MYTWRERERERRERGMSEKAELEKQIGCMAGMLHRLVARRLTGDTNNNNNTLPPPPSDRAILSSGTQREEYRSSSPQIILEYTPRKNSAENQSVSTESSRTSLSSSLDYKKTTNSNVDAETVGSGIQCIVKDSINGLTRGLSVKTSNREEVKKEKVLKYRDSPRPTLPADINPSSDFLARLKEAPRNLSEVPRFSCDGREMSRTKSTRIREVPRLSLDSRDQSSLQSPNQRSPSVIAKLMGLEAMPNSSESQETTISMEKNTSNDSDTRSRHSSPMSKHIFKQNETVYSQIERRVGELDFQESNKDLRALKHILGAMQAKGLLATKKSDEQLAKVQTPQVTTTTRAFDSPIVIMKSAKSINRLEDLEGLSGLRKLRTSTSGVVSRKQVRDEAVLRVTTCEKKQTPAMQRSPRPQQAAARERSASPVKTSSPRLQQRKTELVKKPRTTTRQSANRQQLEPSMSPRVKPYEAEEYELVDEVSCSKDGNVDAKGDDCSMEINSPLVLQGKQKKLLWIASEEVSMVEPTLLPSEQPSPISVLDASFYYEELSPSPVKTISTSLKDDEMPTSTKDYEIPTSPCETLPPKPSPIIDSWKLGNIKSLVQKLKQLSSIDGDESLQVLEILLASGVQGESTLAKAKPENLQNRLMHDVVQEVLVQKLEVISHGPQSDLFVGSKKFGGQLLLRELCSEIKWLLAERPRVTGLDNGEEAMSADDLLPRSQGWEDFGLEVPCLVLEIERSIFKDLIDEVVTGESNSNLLTLRLIRRRKLFT